MASIGTVDIQVREPRQRRLKGWCHDGYAGDVLAVEGAEHDASMFVNDGGAEPHLRGDAVEPVTNRIERWDIAHRDWPLDEATVDDRVLAIHLLRAVDGTNDLSQVFEHDPPDGDHALRLPAPGPACFAPHLDFIIGDLSSIVLARCVRQATR